VMALWWVLVVRRDHKKRQGVAGAGAPIHPTTPITRGGGPGSVEKRR
jgi:hypothetical protein